MKTARDKGAFVLVWLVPALALFFAPCCVPPFSAPKNALLLLATGICAGIAVSGSKRTDLRLLGKALCFASAAWLACTTFSFVASQWRYLGMSSIVWAFTGILLYHSATVLLPGKTSRFLTALSAACVPVAIITVLQFCFDLDLFRMFGHESLQAGRMRMYATLGNPDFVAAFLAAALPAPVALACTTNWRRTWYGVTGVIAAAIALTGSRAGLIALCASAVVLLLLLNRGKTALMIGTVIIAFAVLIGTVGLLNKRPADEALRGRIFIWQVTLSEPWSVLGSGPGTFAYLYPSRLGDFFQHNAQDARLRFAGHERHAANDFVESWHDTGLAGFACFIALLGIAVASCLRVLRQFECRSHAHARVVASIAGVSALFVSALFDFPFHRAETWALIWLWLALPLAEHAASVASNAEKLPDFSGSRESPTAGDGSKIGGSGSNARIWLFRNVAAVVLVVGGAFLAFGPALASYSLASAEARENRNALDPASLVALQRSLKWDNASPDAHFSVVRVLALQGRYEEALLQSEVALRFVNEPELWLLRARIHIASGHADVARRELEAAAARFPYALVLRDELRVVPAGTSHGTVLR